VGRVVKLKPSIGAWYGLLVEDIRTIRVEE